MARCVFCGSECDDFTGTFLLKNDGTSVYYCSQKCMKNHLKLKRDKRKLKWTAAYKEVKAHESQQAKREAEAEAEKKHPKAVKAK